ncbi:MAG: hypothetical protein ABW124_18795 [Candidatus Thiodiazotropha sp. 6PLUC9]
MISNPRIDFVKYSISKDGTPVITPQREDLVSLCVILNEWSRPGSNYNLPFEVRNLIDKNETYKMSSEDGDHQVDISLVETVLRRCKRTINDELKICSEFQFGTKEILLIIEKWHELLVPKK